MNRRSLRGKTSSKPFSSSISQRAARNRLKGKGKVVAIENVEVAEKAKVRMAAPTTITAIISRQAVEEQNIKTRHEVEAL